MRNPPENQHAVSQKKLVFQENYFWGSSMMTLNSFYTKFISCRGKLIKIKQNEKHFVRCHSKDWKWPWLVGFKWFEWCRPLWPLWGICYTSCLPKFGHQTLNWPSIRYIVPAKISPALPLCHKNWFCGKVHLDNFYPLLRSKSSSWIHIAVKRISQACRLHHLENMQKKL